MKNYCKISFGGFESFWRACEFFENAVLQISNLRVFDNKFTQSSMLITGNSAQQATRQKTRCKLKFLEKKVEN